MEYAGFWKRFAAALIDCIILIIGGAIIGAIAGGFIGGFLGASGESIQTIENVASAIGYIIGIILNWIYFTLLESSEKQASWGKRALKIKVTDMHGQRISFARANGRYWAKIISAIILLIGYFMAAFTEKKQALHDKMSDCLVINSH
jgi:uncharacterized RDD family membrane protein YckC